MPNCPVPNCLVPNCPTITSLKSANHQWLSELLTSLLMHLVILEYKVISLCPLWNCELNCFLNSLGRISQTVLCLSRWSARLCWKISPLSKPILDGTRGETVEGKRPLEVLYIGRAAAQDHHQVEFYSSTVGKDPAGSQIKKRFKITKRFSAKQSVMPHPVWRKTYHIIILILILLLISQMRG